MAGKFITRDLYHDLKRDLSRNEMAFVIGPRQAGKTTLMKLLEEELSKEGEKTLFLSLDFEFDRPHFLSQQSLVKKIELEMGRRRGFVFLDEIQRKEDAGLFLKGIYDLGLPYKFIVSGSGSIDLKAKVRESLVGRKRDYELYPLSLKEFVNYRTDYAYENNLRDFFSLEGLKSQGLLLEYLNFGGYPRVVLERELREKTRTIDEIYRGYVEKDIAYILKVEKVDAFGLLLKVLADQIGKLLNYSEISNTLGISLPTVKNYLWYAEKTFILQRVSPFFRNVRNEISKSPTVYFSDPGLRNYMLGIFGNLARAEDLGYAFQNLVFSLLRDKLRFTNAKIHFWRTKSRAEIDFVLDMGRRLMPVEVKYSEFRRPVVPRAFHGFMDKYGAERGIVINKNLRADAESRGRRISYLTIWDLIFEDLA